MIPITQAPQEVYTTHTQSKIYVNETGLNATNHEQLNHRAVNDFKTDSPQMKRKKKKKNREHKHSQLSKGITKNPHRLGSNKMGKILKSQIEQQIILREPTHDNT